MTDPKFPVDETRSTPMVETQQRLTVADAERIKRDVQLDAANRIGDGVMVATLDGNGDAQVHPGVRPGFVPVVPAPFDGSVVQGPAKDAAELEEVVLIADQAEIDARVDALQNVIIEKVAWERQQIFEVVLGYASDTEQHAMDLLTSGKRERKRLRKTGHVIEAEKAMEAQQQRAAAFRVRAAIAADIAEKIRTGWGRNPDGTIQEIQLGGVSPGLDGARPGETLVQSIPESPPKKGRAWRSASIGGLRSSVVATSFCSPAVWTSRR